MRRQGFWRSVRCAPGFFPTGDDPRGLSSGRGRDASTFTAALESGTMRAPVFESPRRNSRASRWSSVQRRVRIFFLRHQDSISRRIAATLVGDHPGNAFHSLDAVEHRQCRTGQRRHARIGLAAIDRRNRGGPPQWPGTKSRVVARSASRYRVRQRNP